MLMMKLLERMAEKLFQLPETSGDFSSVTHCRTSRGRGQDSQVLVGGPSLEVIVRQSRQDYFNNPRIPELPLSLHRAALCPRFMT